MPLSEMQTKEALREANDWLVVSDVPGKAAALEGIANVIGMLMMGVVVPRDLDDLASTVEEYGTQTADLHAAVVAAFTHVKTKATPRQG